MKLKFELKNEALEYLYKFLTLIYQHYWDSKACDENVVINIAEDALMFYLDDADIQGNLYARVIITEIQENLFSSLKIQSLKEKNAVVFSPSKMSEFLEKIKLYANSQYDARFTLK